MFAFHSLTEDFVCEEGVPWLHASHDSWRENERASVALVKPSRNDLALGTWRENDGNNALVQLNKRTFQHVSQAIKVSLSDDAAEILLGFRAITSEELCKHLHAGCSESLGDRVVTQHVVCSYACLSCIQASPPHNAARTGGELKNWREIKQTRQE